MSNTLLTTAKITNEALVILENSLTFAKNVNRDYDEQFAVAGAKIGDTINIRKPVRSIGRRTPGLQVENFTETSVPLTLNNQYGDDCSFTSAEMALSMDDFSDRVLKPKIATISNMIDYDGMQQYKNVANLVGTPGVTPAALLTYLSARVKLQNEGTPTDTYAAVINPIAQATIVDALKGLFNSQPEIAKQYLEGNMGLAAGMKWSMDQNVGVQTIGALGGTPLVNGASQAGSSLITDGWTAAAATRLNVGDVFVIANVNAVNPQSRISTGQLRQFVVTAAGVSDGSGNMTISISPALVGPDVNGNPTQYQNVDSYPADNAALTIYGTASTVTPQNMLFHRDAFAFGTADLPIVGGVDMCKRVSSKQLGMSLRLTRAYDINNDRFPCRFDLLGGWTTLRQEMACRIAG